MKFRVALVGAVFFSFIAEVRGATWWADAVNGNDTWDGRARAYEAATGHGPKKTLQAAVNLAAAGDTVIALPGVYDQGGEKDAWGDNYKNWARVLIKNRITLTSEKGRETRDDRFVRPQLRTHAAGALNMT